MRAVSLRLLLCCLALVAATAGVAVAVVDRAPTDGPAGSGLRLGLVANTLGWGTQMGRQQSIAKAAGAGWLREELEWGAIEPRPGLRRFARIDALFTAAAHRGLRILPLLNDAPGWAAGRDGALPTRTAAYGRFVAAVVARYGPGGRYWRTHPTLDGTLAPEAFELWNEPYFARPSHSAITAGRYAALAGAAVRAGKKVNPRARYLLAVDPATAGGTELSRQWLDRVVAARPGLLADVDGVTAHPYAQTAGDALRSVDRLRAALTAEGSALPIWVTEVGWSTCARGGGCVTERRQAADIRGFLTGARRRAGVAAVFVYHLTSWRVRSGAQLFGDFGLLRADRTRKPAWSAYQRFARGLRGGTA